MTCVFLAEFRFQIVDIVDVVSRQAAGRSARRAPTRPTGSDSERAGFESFTETGDFVMTAALDPGRPFTGGERELLEDTLALNRKELVRAVEQLSDAQARTRLVSSLTTPISLVKHCAAAERIWFQRTLGGVPVEECGGHAVGGDSSFRVAEGETLAGVIAEYAGAWARSNDVAGRFALDDVVEHHIVGPVSLRFIFLGMIAETARHAGHADVLAEQIRDTL
jgi:hypothetical protein